MDDPVGQLQPIVMCLAAPSSGHVWGSITALVNYQHQFVATGGMPPYTYSPSGSLPTGMTVTSEGLLVGVPHAVGSFAFTVRATDFFAKRSPAPSR